MSRWLIECVMWVGVVLVDGYECTRVVVDGEGRERPVIVRRTGKSLPYLLNQASRRDQRRICRCRRYGFTAFNVAYGGWAGGAGGLS